MIKMNSKDLTLLSEGQIWGNSSEPQLEVIRKYGTKAAITDLCVLAGDMTVYGLRDDVKLIRENANGKQEIIPLDLNKAETILSPYYYLQQNDIIYVTPNKAKARNSDIGTSTSLWFSATSILVSIASLLFNILK